MSNFFIMLNLPGGKIVPLTDDDETAALYETEQEARDIAKEHQACSAYGFEIFQRGCGE